MNDRKGEIVMELEKVNLILVSISAFLFIVTTLIGWAYWLYKKTPKSKLLKKQEDTQLQGAIDLDFRLYGNLTQSTSWRYFHIRVLNRLRRIWSATN